MFLKHTRQLGFTLIELLVVLAMIALLISLPLPMMSKSRAIAKQVKCRSNLKQVSLAGIAYTIDHDGFAPDKLTTGGYGFRRGPGMTNPNDPFSLPETFGPPSPFDRMGYFVNGGLKT